MTTWDGKPAMSALEWKRQWFEETDRDGPVVIVELVGDQLWVIDGESGQRRLILERHALAALCLKDQPYGFTREDVELLRAWAEDMRASAERNDRPTGLSARYAVQIDNLAARIEALLPPEEE
jgi:hypothetical protein